MTSRIANEGLQVVDLTKDFASQHAKELVELANLIPQVVHTEADIMAEAKGDRRLHGKWLHGLAVVDPSLVPFAFVGAYEREGEGNDQYPANTLYVSDLAVSKDLQRRGIARELMDDFFEKNDDTGLLVLPGELNYSLQTNSADWNKHVVDFYQSFGFEQRALKEYEDRTDVVLGRKLSK